MFILKPYYDPKNTEGQGQVQSGLNNRGKRRRTQKNCAPRISLREHEVRFARFAHSSGLIYDIFLPIFRVFRAFRGLRRVQHQYFLNSNSKFNS